MYTKAKNSAKVWASGSGTHATAPRSELVAVPLFPPPPPRRLDADLFVVLLERREVLPGFRKLTFLHALTDIPMDKCSLGVHEIELVVDTREDLRDGRGVADHAACAHHLGQVASRHNRRRLIVDAVLEAS